MDDGRRGGECYYVSTAPLNCPDLDRTYESYFPRDQSADTNTAEAMTPARLPSSRGDVSCQRGKACNGPRGHGFSARRMFLFTC